MLERILQLAIAQRWLVLLLTLAMAALGLFSYQKLAIDAVPDITNVQVQINTKALDTPHLKQSNGQLSP